MSHHYNTVALPPVAIDENDFRNVAMIPGRFVVMKNGPSSLLVLCDQFGTIHAWKVTEKVI